MNLSKELSSIDLLKVLFIGSLLTSLLFALLTIPYVYYFAGPSEFLGNQIVLLLEDATDNPETDIKIQVEKLAGPELIDYLSGFFIIPIMIFFTFFIWLFVAPGWWLYRLKIRKASST